MIGQIEIEARQNQRSVGQLGDRLHQQVRRPARPGRPGQDDRMLRRNLLPQLRQVFGHHSQPGGRIRVGRLVLDLLHDRQELQCPRPMVGMGADIEICECVKGHPFALHLVKQRGEAIGQIIQRGARGEVRFLVDQRAHQLHQPQSPSERRGRRRDIPKRDGFPEIRHQLNAGKQPGRPGIEQRPDPARHPPGVHDQDRPAERLGRQVLGAMKQSVHQRRRKIRPGGHAKDAGFVARLKHAAPASLRRG